MDWTKAKTIIMVALALTILFLLFTYGIEKIEPETDEEIPQEETLKLLEKKNIFLNGQLPQEHDRMAVLNVEYDVLDPDILESCMSRQKGMPSDQRKAEDAVEYAKEFLDDCGIYDKNVVFKSVSKDGSAYIIEYQNRVKGYALEESYMICTVQDGKVVSLDRFWLDPVDFGKNKKVTLSASAALVNFMMQREGQEEMYISHMEMVYWLDTETVIGETPLSDTAFPAWKIVYNGGSVSYIKAYESE